MQSYFCKVLGKKNLTHDVLELELSKPADLKFFAGQYVGFQMEYTARSYSMVSSPEESTLRFCIKIVEDGIGGEFVKNLKVGDSFEISGPFGQFVVPSNVMPDCDPASRLNNLDSGSGTGMTSRINDLLFVATGVGIAPVRSIIFDLLNRGFKTNITLLFGVRSEQDIFYRNIFFDLEEKYSNFKFIPILSQPKKDWKGETGRVTYFLIKHSGIIKNEPSFICGSQGMVTDVQDILLRAGVVRENIKTEIFF